MWVGPLTTSGSRSKKSCKFGAQRQIRCSAELTQTNLIQALFALSLSVVGISIIALVTDLKGNIADKMDLCCLQKNKHLKIFCVVSFESKSLFWTKA